MNKRIIKFALTLLLSVGLAFSVFTAACNLVATDTYYTVTFDSDGGSSVNAQSVKSGETATEPADPAKEGYIFEGWYLGSAQYDFDTEVTADITLTAKWTEKTPDITDPDPDNPDNPDKPDPATEYTVTFDSNSGSAVASVKVEDGKTVSKPDDPTRDGYIFEGWYIGNEEYNFSAPVTANITLTAKWTEKAPDITDPDPDNPDNPDKPDPDPVTEYTVAFDSNGGSAVDSVQVEDGKTVSKPDDPTRDGYIFEGWYIGNEEYSFSAPVTADITLTAKWTEIPPEINYFTVSFDSDGGSKVASQYVQEGCTAAEPAEPEKENYVFAGWYLNDTEYDFSSEIRSDLTLTAKWTPDTSVKYFTVSFVSNCRVTVNAQQVEKGGKAVKPADPVNEGYVLVYWCSDDLLYDVYDFDSAVTDDITLYAKWAPDTSVEYFEVIFDTDGGSSVSAQAVASGKTAVKPDDPIKEGYSFEGWYTEAEFVNLYNFGNAVSQNIRLFAKWEEDNTPIIPAPADGVSINFNSFTDDSTTLTEGSTIADGLIILKGGSWTVDKSNSNITDANGDTVSVAKRLKSGGKRTMDVDLSDFDGTVKLQFFVRTASSSDTTRTVSLQNAEDTVCGSLTLSEDSVLIFEVTVEAGSVYTLSTSAGINFYAINIIPV